MAHRSARKNTAPPEGSPKLSRESAASLLPPGLEVAAPLLDALPGRLDGYLDLLLTWNRAINLTGGRNRAEILNRLIPDSFHLAAFLESPELSQLPALAGAPRVWDLGAGAGLPGIPLRMVWDKGAYTLVEAREKRALFLANALAALDLPRTTAFRGTAEALFAREPLGADIILSRAFMPWEKLLTFCEPGLAPGSLLIVFASEACGTLPAPWRLAAERDYCVGQSRRWFWALQHGEMPHA